MKRTFSLLLFLTFAAAAFIASEQTACADVYTKTRMMNGMTESESWTAGKKQRTSAKVPMAGEIVTIIRLDRGVEYQLMPARSIYQEKPIALTYGAETEEMPDQEELAGLFSKSGAKKSDTSMPCDPKVTKLSEKRTYAGFETTGYQAVCAGEGGATIWLAETSAPWAPLEAARRETEAFQKAYLEAQYADYPQNERREMIKNMEAFGMMMGQGLLGMPDMQKLPKGMPLAMETAAAFMGGGEGSSVMFEILELNQAKADPSLFEIPAGYQQVPDIHQAMAGNMLGQLAGFMEELQAQVPAEESESWEEEGTEAEWEDTAEEENTDSDFADDVPPGMIRRPGPNGWIYEPDPSASDPQAVPVRRRPGPNGWIYESAQTPGPAQVRQQAQQMLQQTLSGAFPGQLDQYAQQLQQMTQGYTPQEGYDESGDDSYGAYDETY